MPQSDVEAAGLTASQAQAIEAQFKRDHQEFAQYQTFIEQLSDAGGQQSTEQLNSQICEWLFTCFKSRWVVIEDYYSTGNQTINTMVKHTPPGLTARIIGMQNIKGTGLDFIYRWQAWDQIYHYCQTLNTARDQVTLEVAVKALTTWEEFGLLDQQLVRKTLISVKNTPLTQTELIQAQLRLIEQRLDKQLTLVELQAQGNKSQSKWVAWCINALEAFLDAGDAIKRRKRADNIYQAILDKLISYDKASVELAKITKAQKGGWLEQRLKRLFEKG